MYDMKANISLESAAVLGLLFVGAMLKMLRQQFSNATASACGVAML
jgi:hypothetical protein